MTETVTISFEGAYDGSSPFVTIYNPGILSGALFSQITRFGLTRPSKEGALLSGRLKGSREGLMGVIQSYVVTVEIVPAIKAIS
jgi:hypothetical protein